MVKIFLITVAVIGILALGIAPLFAREIGEVSSTVWDTVTNQNDSCPALIEPYIAKTWKDTPKKDVDFRVELGYQCELTDLTENNEVKLKFGFEL